jgi:hypothetical protein
MYTAAMAKGMDEDFSIVIKFMEELAGLSTLPEELLQGPAHASHERGNGETRHNPTSMS